jgi:3-oxoacyl-[acyl-carrier-protein] synthase II
VVVTGLGVVTPVGLDVETVFERLLHGPSGVVAPIRHGAARPPSRAVGEIPPAAQAALARRHPEVAALGDPRTLYGFAAASAALADAGIEPGRHARGGVSLAAGPGVHRLEDVDRVLGPDGAFDAVRFARRVAEIHPESAIRSPPERPAALVARAFGLGGGMLAPTTACAASNQALGLALRAVRSGRADFVVAGGADCRVNPVGLVWFVLLGASATVDGDPAEACRPFDRRRTGLVIGEGAGCAVLESEDRARARGARVYAEVAGYGASLDAFRATAPPPDGRGAAIAMARALADAGVAPSEVDFVNAHGTGTKRNDPAEVRAIRTVFGEHADRLAVSSVKPMMGHLLAAAAGVAFASTVLAVERDVVPPTMNLRDPDPACDLDHVPLEARRMRVRAALNNAFAFGGQNAVLVVRKAPGGAT